MHLNWLAITDLRGAAGPLFVCIIVNYSCTRKMLKRNNRLFRHILILGGISIGGGVPLATPMPPPGSPQKSTFWKNLSEGDRFLISVDI